MSSAQDLALQASVRGEGDRLLALAQNLQSEAKSLQPLTYQGADPATGGSRYQRLGQGAVTGGELITTAALEIGQPVLSRSLGGLTRLDGPKSNAGSTVCGGDGSPKAPSDPGQGASSSDPSTLPTSVFPPSAAVSCPRPGTLVAGSQSCLGLALTYQVYTGRAIGNPPVCEKTLVVVPNASQCRRPGTPFDNLGGSDGCVTDTTLPASNCQWYTITEEQALAGTGAPEGTYFTGYAELPLGTFRGLYCSLPGDSPPAAGIGCDWQNPPQGCPGTWTTTYDVFQALTNPSSCGLGDRGRFSNTFAGYEYDYPFLATRPNTESGLEVCTVTYYESAFDGREMFYITGGYYIVQVSLTFEKDDSFCVSP